MSHQQSFTPQDLLHDLIAVDAEMSYVEALLRMHLRHAEQSGDRATIERILQHLAA